MTTGLQYIQMAACINFQIDKRIFHAIGIADMSSTMKNNVLAFHGFDHSVQIADISDDKFDFIYDAGNVELVSSMIWQFVIQNRNVRSVLDRFSSSKAAYHTQATCN